MLNKKPLDREGMPEPVQVLHKARSGRLILKSKKKVTTGMILFDSRRRPVARIVELIGPVNSPYASATILNKEMEVHEGQKLYYEGED